MTEAHKDNPIEFSRWQGEIDTTMKENTRRLDTINGDIRNILQTTAAAERHLSDGLNDLKVAYATDMATVKTKVALFSTAGSVVGAGVVTIIVNLIGGPA